MSCCPLRIRKSRIKLQTLVYSGHSGLTAQYWFLLFPTRTPILIRGPSLHPRIMWFPKCGPQISNMLEMQIPGPHPTYWIKNSVGVVQHSVFYNKPSKWFWTTVKCENHCSKGIPLLWQWLGYEWSHDLILVNSIWREDCCTASGKSLLIPEREVWKHMASLHLDVVIFGTIAAILLQV